MNSLHKKLSGDFPWYAKWHQMSHISLIHFVLLTAFVSGTVLLLQTPLIASNQQLAASVVATTKPAAYAPGRILVQFKTGVNDTDQTADLKGQGAEKKSTIAQIHTHIVSVPVGAEMKVATALAHNPHVQFAEPDYVVTTQAIPNDPYYGSQWFSPIINEPAGWDITTGSPSIIVAVLDSAIPTFEDNANNMVPGYDMYTGSTNLVADGCSHGAAVGGVIANEGNNGVGTAGIAWHVKLMSIAVATVAGGGCSVTTWSTLASGVTYAADHGARVINASWGGPYSGTMDSAIQYAWNKNVLFFAAAGNDGSATVEYPASSPYAISVAATANAGNGTDVLAGFSSHGAGLDISAPGDNIITTAGGTGGYGGWSGTSFSSPMAAGLAALVLSVNPRFTAQQVVDLIEKNADDLGTPGWDESYGWGRINVGKTLAAAQTAIAGGSTDTTAPSASLTAPTNGAAVVGGVSISVNASDNVGVTKVELYKDGVLYATTASGPYSFYWDATTATVGTHTLSAKAYDAAGNVGTSAGVTVNVQAPPPAGPDTTLPSVSITAPKNGTKVKGNGAVTITVTAADASGISSIAIMADGVQLKTCPNTTSCSASWSGKSISAGSHTITASAMDASANKNAASAAVSISK